MADLPQLTEADIRQWIGEPSLGRGQGYFRQGNILNPRRQGQTLKARCLGSRPQPYRVETVLGADGIVSGYCSCPVGAGGHCKHAAALLLTWLHEPEAFLEIESLDTALEGRSKAELIDLIRKMLRRYPDLEMLLELPVIGDAAAGQPLDPELIRRQVSGVLRGGEYEGGAAYVVAQDLHEVVDLGEGYAQQGDWRNAATVYQTVAREVLESYEAIHDEEGDLTEIVDRCLEGLAGCLAACQDPVQREGMLRVLFDVYRWDVDFGGIGMGDDVPAIIVEQASPEERRRVAGWVRESLPRGGDWSDGWQRQVYGGFLLDLGQDMLDDEAFLRICRETGRSHDLVNRLLDLGRVDEAIDEARRVGDFELLSLADLFAHHVHGDLAEQLIWERTQASQDGRLRGWLKKRAEERGDLDTALVLAEAMFWEYPTLTGYQEIRDLAQRAGCWDALRPQFLARLEGDGRYGLLTEIHLEDGEVAQALVTLERMQGARPWAWAGSLSVRVAEAAEETLPHEAICLYLARVHQLISARGRGNYAEAVTYLLRVRSLYRGMGEGETWQALIARIREQNSRLRALKDELNRAGL